MGGAPRQDAWSEEDDLMLAEIVLRHVREGSTQLKAFEEAGEKLSRTAAACGFRWNACLRSNYEAALELAKQQRQKKGESASEKRSISTVETEKKALLETNRTRFVKELENTISFLQELAKELAGKKDASFLSLQREKETLEKEVQALERELEQMKSSYDRLKEDYKALIDVMDKARALTEHSLPYLQEKREMEESG